MRIFDSTKTVEITNPDLSLGKLIPDKLVIAHHEAVTATPEKTVQQLEEEWVAAGGKVTRTDDGKVYKVLKEYPNGGKTVKEIQAIPAVPAHEEYDEYEDIYVYIPYTAAELTEINANKIRAKREVECFPIINRGLLWYENLTEEQRAQLSVWYQAWLDAPATGIIPIIPSWVK